MENAKKTTTTTCMLITRYFLFLSSLSHFVVLKFNFFLTFAKNSYLELRTAPSA